MLDIAIRGGTIVRASESVRADVGILQGKVAEIGAVGDARDDIDASGRLLLPGLVDPHTHLETQFRADGPVTADDFFSGTVAAAFGGVTTVIDYARQFPGMSLRDALEAWAARARARSAIDISPHLIVTDFSDATLAEVGALVADGYPTVKAFMMRVADDELLRLMQAAVDAGGLLMAHAENGQVLDARRRRLEAEGKRAARWYADSRPEIGEAEATSRVIDYAELLGADICVVHVSCDAALQRIRDGKRRGVRVRGEVRPCYLLLDDSVYARPDVNPLEHSGCPPYRPAWNLPRLWDGLADGTLDMVGSDHCTWSIQDKSIGADDFSLIPHGIPALETELPTLWTTGVNAGKITANRLVEAMSTATAKLHGLYPRKGDIAVGSDADIVIFDPSLEVTIAAARMHSRVGYEPCEGMRCVGWPVATLSRGEVIVRDGACLAAPGRGQVLKRERPSDR